MRRSRLGEFVVRGTLRASPRTVLGRACLKTLVQARKTLVRRSDPLIRRRVGAFDLLMPLSHNLPFYLHDSPEYGAAIGRIARQIRGPVIDVGANVGDTAALVRTVTEAPILCIEGDRHFFTILRRNAAQFRPPPELEHAFVAGETGTVRGTLRREGGTTQLVAGAGDDVPVRTLSEILAGHPGFAGPRLVKIDTDGFDVPIILAELELLARLRPVLFFEYDPSLGAEPVVFERLFEIGYRRAHVYVNSGELIDTVDVGEGVPMRGEYVDVCTWHEDDEEPAP